MRRRERQRERESEGERKGERERGGRASEGEGEGERKSKKDEDREIRWMDDSNVTLLGDKINCDGFTKFSQAYAQDFCWTVGLYTIKEAYHLPAEVVPYPGVIPKDIPSCQSRMLKNGLG